MKQQQLQLGDSWDVRRASAAFLSDRLHAAAFHRSAKMFSKLRISTSYTELQQATAADRSQHRASSTSQHDTGLCCCWLQLIAFYFTYLLEDLHPGLASRVCLMPPGSSFLLLNSGVLDF